MNRLVDVCPGLCDKYKCGDKGHERDGDGSGRRTKKREGKRGERKVKGGDDGVRGGFFSSSTTLEF